MKELKEFLPVSMPAPFSSAHPPTTNSGWFCYDRWERDSHPVLGHDDTKSDNGLLFYLENARKWGKKIRWVGELSQQPKEDNIVFAEWEGGLKTNL